MDPPSVFHRGEEVMECLMEILLPLYKPNLSHSQSSLIDRYDLANNEGYIIISVRFFLWCSLYNVRVRIIYSNLRR